MNHSTIDPAILEAAILGFTLQRSRIDDSIASLRAELEDVRPDRPASQSCRPEAVQPRKKRFSAAARKRMALAQKKRWQLLKAKKAEAVKPKRNPAAKRKTATVTASRKQHPVQLKAAKKVARKVVKVAANPRVKKTAPKPKVKNAVEALKVVNETLAAPVQVAAEPAPATA